MQFKKGDRVKFVDEGGSAIVTRQDAEGVWLITEDDFELCYQAHELIMYKEMQVGQTVQKDVVIKKNFKIKLPPKSEYLEQDLHINQLVDFTGGMTNFDMLRKQLWTAKNTIQKAKNAGIKKVILIHGVGEGILRQELYKLLDAHENLNYYDADMAKYGKGATEVVMS